jgi:hypothetical protein
VLIDTVNSKLRVSVLGLVCDELPSACCLTKLYDRLASVTEISLIANSQFAW